MQEKNQKLFYICELRERSLEKNVLVVLVVELRNLLYLTEKECIFLKKKVQIYLVNEVPNSSALESLYEDAAISSNAEINTTDIQGENKTKQKQNIYFQWAGS